MLRILSILSLAALMLVGCTINIGDDNTEKTKKLPQFVLIKSSGQYDFICDTETDVVYLRWYMYRDMRIGVAGMTVYVDTNGKPILCNRFDKPAQATVSE